MSRQPVLLLVLLIGPLGGLGRAQVAVDAVSHVAPEEARTIEAFFARQASLFNQRDLQTMMQAYDAGFTSEVHHHHLDRSALEKTYRAAIGDHAGASLKPYVSHIEKLGNRYAVAVCQAFSSQDLPPEQADDWCHLFVLEQRPAGLAILRMFDIDHRKAAAISNAANRYDNRELRFRFSRPRDYFLVYQGMQTGFLDNFRLIDRTLQAEIQVSVFPSLLAANRDDLVSADDRRLGDATDDYQVDQPPTAFATRQGVAGIYTEARFVISETSPLAAHLPATGDYKLARIYLSPDQRILFALTFQAPADLFDHEVGAFRDFAESLELTQVNASRYWDQITELRGLGRVENRRVLQHGKLVSFTAPDGWLAEILPGQARLQCVLVPDAPARVGQMELEVLDQKNTTPIGEIVTAELSDCGDATRIVLERQQRRLLDVDAVDLTVQVGEGIGQRCVRAVYFRTKDQLFVASLKTCTRATTQKLSPAFEQWLSSFQLARN